MPSPGSDLAILRHLASRTYATAAEIGTACTLTAAEVRARLANLESQRLIAGRQDPDTKAPRRIYAVTAEGRRKAGITVVRPASP